ncbi:hypothetical protein ON010_g9892 [Phytophthora cinnamomi]|nr:hypothetical protein ON010_g9892 [Phytophthora cinnamomi]
MPQTLVLHDQLDPCSVVGPHGLVSDAVGLLHEAAVPSTTVQRDVRQEQHEVRDGEGDQHHEVHHFLAVDDRVNAEAKPLDEDQEGERVQKRQEVDHPREVHGAATHDHRDSSARSSALVRNTGGLQRDVSHQRGAKLDEAEQHTRPEQANTTSERFSLRHIGERTTLLLLGHDAFSKMK